MPDSSSDPSNHDRAWGICIAAIFGMWFLFFAVGLVFGPRDPDTTLGILLSAVAFTVWLGCMTIGGIGIAAKQRWAHRFTDRLFGVAVLGIQAIVVRGLIMAAATQDAPSAASYYAAGVWIGMGLVMYFGRHGKRTPKPTYLDCALWPLLIFLKAPLASICLFAIPAVLVVGGEWIGAKFQHPHIGAAVGFGTFLAVVAFVTYWSSHLTASVRDGPKAAQQGTQSDTNKPGD
jgi:hypothetical protein